MTSDMRPVSQHEQDRAGSVPPQDKHGSAPAKSRGAPWAMLLGGLGVVAGLSGLAAAAWVHSNAQADARRIASEIAQLRVSLDLYARNGSNAAPAAAEDGLTELSNRLAILEQNWREGTAPSPTATTTTAPSAATNEECLPSGMRILVAQGDSYPVCEHPVTINVGQVANGYIVLLDGTTIASGGSMPLPGSPCTIGVTSGGDEGLTGYAEIRVAC